MFKEISGHTKLMCLIAHPAAGSSSPKLHNASFEEQGLDARYMAFDVTPDSLGKAVEGMKALGVCGWSVGVPHKKAIIPLLDEVSEAARLMESVNCVQVLKDGRLVGHNTDGLGFVEALEDAGVEVKGASIAIIDDNAEGPSWIVQAALAGAEEIYVLCPAELFDEKWAWTQQLADKTGCRIPMARLSKDYQGLDIPGYGTNLSAGMLHGFEAVCNGSRIGTGITEGISPLPATLLEHDMVVIDANYNPSETQLMKDAKKRGCKVVGGMTPLLNQAAHAQRLWLDCEMPKEAVGKKLLIEEALGAIHDK